MTVIARRVKIHLVQASPQPGQEHVLGEGGPALPRHRYLKYQRLTSRYCRALHVPHLLQSDYWAELDTRATGKVDLMSPLPILFGLRN